MQLSWTSKTLAAAAVAGTLLAAAPAHALLIAGPDIIAAPTLVLDVGVSNTHQQGFNERQGVTLGAALAVDAGSIAAGTVVNSHMIFFNLPAAIGSGNDTQTWAFDGVILGVMSDVGGTLEAASSAILGAIGTIYPVGFPNRGLDGSPDNYSVAGNVITVTMVVGQPGDWIRVVTAVPEPASLALLGLGLAGLGVGRRKQA